METLRTLSFYFTRPVYSRRSPTNQSKQNLISLFLAAHSCLLWICKTMACVLFEFFQENHLTRTKALQLFQRFQTIAGPNKRCITPKKEWQTPSPTTKKKNMKIQWLRGWKTGPVRRPSVLCISPIFLFLFVMSRILSVEAKNPPKFPHFRSSLAGEVGGVREWGRYWLDLVAISGTQVQAYNKMDPPPTDGRSARGRPHFSNDLSL